MRFTIEDEALLYIKKDKTKVVVIISCAIIEYHTYDSCVAYNGSNHFS